MIDERLIKQLKQTNISKNIAVTKERINEIWKSATKMQKSRVELISGVSRATIYRVYNNGKISAKLAVAIAKVFNVDPYYLTGMSNKLSRCTDQIIYKFLTDLGYKNLPIKANEETGEEAEAVSDTAIPESKAPSVAVAKINADLTSEDIQTLIQSLLIREKAGVKSAVDKMAKLRELLLS